MRNSFKILIIVAILIFAPLIPKGFLRPSVAFTNYENNLYLKSSEFFKLLKENKFIQSSSLDLKTLDQKYKYSNNISLFKYLLDLFDKKTIKLIPKQSYFFDYISESNCTLQDPYQDTIRHFLATLDFEYIKCKDYNKKQLKSLKNNSVISFNYLGKSHQVPFELIKPNLIQNSITGQGLSLAGFKQLHSILDLPFALYDEIQIDKGGGVTHSFKNQIIDIAKLTSDLYLSKIDIDLEFVNPPLVKIKNSSFYNNLSQISSIKTTFYGSGENRIFNIVKGVNDISTFVLSPGETFSFNDKVGDVDENSGYKEALVITSKGIVKGYGGGLCQVSTTFYRAALLNGLEILERHPHSHAINYYSQVLGHGLDAAIYIGVKDLIFKNTFDYPLIFEPLVLGNEIIINLYAENRLDFKLSNYQVYDKVTKDEVKVEGDPLNGNLKVIQNSIPGFKTSWDLEFSNGKKEKVLSTYLPKQKVVSFSN